MTIMIIIIVTIMIMIILCHIMSHTHTHPSGGFSACFHTLNWIKVDDISTHSFSYVLTRRSNGLSNGLVEACCIVFSGVEQTSAISLAYATCLHCSSRPSAFIRPWCTASQREDEELGWQLCSSSFYVLHICRNVFLCLAPRQTVTSS